MDILQINKLDNVAVALTDLTKGKIIQIDEHDIILKENIPAGHKIALKISTKMNKLSSIASLLVMLQTIL